MINLKTISRPKAYGKKFGSKDRYKIGGLVPESREWKNS